MEGMRKITKTLIEDSWYPCLDYNQVPPESNPESLSLEPAYWNIDEETRGSASGGFCQEGGQNLKTGSESSRSKLERRSCQMLLNAGVYSYYYNYWSQQYCRLE